MSLLHTLRDKVMAKDKAPASSTSQSPSPSRALVPQQMLATQYAYCADRGYEFNNNLWGAAAANSGSQSTQYYGADAAGGPGVRWGSTWTWAGGPHEVKSYVWVNRQFQRPLLSQVKALPTRTEWTYTGSKMRANVAYDIFTDKDPNHANSSGEYEVMIWLARYGGLEPISRQGKPLERITIAGHRFDLHFGYNGLMKVYSFVAVDDPIQDFRADVLDFFKLLQSKHGFPMNDQYMLIYQFGTEAVTGRDADFHNARFEADVIV